MKDIVNTPQNDAVVSFDYQYNIANQRVRATTSDGSYWIYEYDNLGRVVSGRKYWNDGSPIAGQQFEYGFDDIGNRKTTASGGNEWGTGLRFGNYTGNFLNQYTARTVPGAVDVIGAAAANATVTVNNEPAYRRGEYFRHELAIGNQASAISQSVTNLAVLNNGASPDILTNSTGRVLLPKSAEAFVHDLDGNLTSDSIWNYVWDGENRLVKMTMKAGTGISGTTRKEMLFDYDWQGRRIGKRVYYRNGTDTGWVLESTLKFIYDGWNLIAERDANDGLVRQYMWGKDLSGTMQGAGGVGGLLKVHNAANSKHHFAGYDGNGNVAILVDGDTGIASAHYEYGPFGEVIRATGTMAKLNPFRFSTKFTDDESGFLYYGFRYYDPITGRWLSRDPIEEEGGLNLYGLIRNLPINKWDVLGLNIDPFTWPDEFPTRRPPASNKPWFFCLPWMPTFETIWFRTGEKDGLFERPLRSWILLSTFEPTGLSNVATPHEYFYRYEERELRRYVKRCHSLCASWSYNSWRDTGKRRWIDGPPVAYQWKRFDE